jgi:hypothetical protein
MTNKIPAWQKANVDAAMAVLIQIAQDGNVLPEVRIGAASLILHHAAQADLSDTGE